ELAVKVFKTIGAEGYARVDFLLGETGSIFVNELNTIPGFTNISMFPRMFVASGLSYEELVNLLIQDALQRHGK
ncbi:MAG: D-alanine--D-alanine ligase A, partial [Candidatus Nanopelagicales bacterium]